MKKNFQIHYYKILKNKLVSVLKDVLILIEKEGLKYGHQLFITFNTKNNKIYLDSWLKKKYPKDMTIVIQYEYWGLKVLKNKFEITLSFNNKKTKLSIPFDAVISFADPYANFGLKINTANEDNLSRKKSYKKNNIVDFAKYKKLN